MIRSEATGRQVSRDEPWRTTHEVIREAIPQATREELVRWLLGYVAHVEMLDAQLGIVRYETLVIGGDVPMANETQPDPRGQNRQYQITHPDGRVRTVTQREWREEHLGQEGWQKPADMPEGESEEFQGGPGLAPPAISPTGPPKPQTPES